MFLRRFTDFVLQSRVSAITTTFVISFIPLIGSINILIAALVTLRKGIGEGLLVTIAATLPSLIMYYIPPVAGEQMHIAGLLLGIMMMSNLLTWMFAAILRRFNWNVTLELAITLGIVTIGIAYLFYTDIQSWLMAQLKVLFAQLPAGEEQKDKMAVIASSFVRLTVFVLIISALVQLLVARWWQALMFNPGGLRKELCQIRLSYVAGMFFIGSMIGAALGSRVAFDIMMLLDVIFLSAGLSVLHYFVGARINKLWWILIYLVMIGAAPITMVVFPVIGLFDTALDFRKRFKI